MTQQTTSDPNLERCISALRSVYQMLKTPLPTSIHQAYINEILEEIGEEKEE